MKLEFSRQDFEKSSNIKFHENSSIGSRVVPCGWADGRTDMTKLIVDFHNFANAPKILQGTSIFITVDMAHFKSVMSVCMKNYLVGIWKFRDIQSLVFGTDS
jgi:hypothetical protein